MPVLDVDNFRGFHETYIPLTNITFLVGENSKGKSSILSLLSLPDNTVFFGLKLIRKTLLQTVTFTTFKIAEYLNEIKKYL